MSKLQMIGRRNALLGTVPPMSLLLILGEKGGVGKTVVCEAASTVLDDAGIAHTVAECEGDPRLKPRLGNHVVHYPLGEQDAVALANDPDLLNVYWDQVVGQMRRGPTVAEIGSNGASLMMAYLRQGKAAETLAYGLGVNVAILTTSDNASLLTAVNTAREVRHVLPDAKIYIVFNPKDGHIGSDHPIMASVLKEAGCNSMIVLPVCRAPDWGTLKNLGRFTDVATMEEKALEKYGIPHLRASRALEGMGQWLLLLCEAIQPLVASLIERNRH